ncbi:MAG: amino acid adenylation domain-containing protein [Halopseudomonas sabulinigri]
MNDIIGLLQQLEQQGVRLALNTQGQLISQSNKGAVTPAIGQQIRDHKDVLIACLRARQQFTAAIQPQGQDCGPLSSSQSGLWFIEQYEESSHLYNMPVYFRLTGELDEAALEHAFDQLLQRHASLRTRFVRNAEGKGEQQILPHQPFRLQREDLSALPEAAREQAVAERVRDEINCPFDLTSGELTRVQLLKLGAREQVLLLTQHHIISDGWSVKNLFADLKPAFLAYQNRQPANLPRMRLSYIDYARWFNSSLFLDYHQKFKAFWVERLAGIPEVHGLPLDKPRPAHQDSGGELVFSAIDQAVWAGFKQLCQRHNTSAFIGLHALFALLIARLSGERDIVIGTPLAYRERPDIEDMLGFFVNTLVLRTQLGGSQPFSEYLQACREQDLAAFDHQLYRFEALSEALGTDRTTAINPIFQIMLVYQAKVDFNDLIPGCDAVEETSPVLPAKTDISVKVTELMDQVRVDWLFATALFERDTVQAYADRLLHLLQAVVEAPEQDIWQLPLAATPLPPLPAQQYTDTRTVTELIERAAQRFPHHLAVRVGEQSMSYAELDQRANQLAHWLLAQGVAPGMHIGILARRDLAFALALLAIWKTGAAYVPLDPAYPAQRLAHIMEDTQMRWVLGGPQQQALRLASDVDYLNILNTALAAELPRSAPAIKRDPQQLAQVIYTSGSTGLPKGVMLEHGALVNLLTDHCQRIDFCATDALFNCMSLAFDAGNMAALVPLSAGGSLTFGEPAADLLEQAEAAGCSHMILPAALLANLTPEAGSSLRAIGFGGEACPPALVERWGQRVALFNMYGPTECTVTALCARLLPGQPVTIGQPINGMQALILDELGNLCAPGVPGELCLTGQGLARGYLNLPERSAEAFCERELQGRKLRYYRTGDRARQLASGDYQYLGRLDEQIKLRGYRIEPGEIEAQLMQVAPALQQVRVCVARLGASDQLVAYATLRSGEHAPQPDEILQLAAAQLPEFMLPSRLILLDQLPLTPNGKLDSQQLPELPQETGAAQADNPLEAQVLGIWQAVLNQPLGVEDDFFRLGGDSILSIQLSTRLRDAGLQCSVKDVFEAKTVRRLCRLLRRQREAIAIRAEQGVLQGEFALLPIQQWFFDLPLATPQHWNQGVLLRLPEGIDNQQLQRWMAALLMQHDSLRLALDASGQRYRSELSPPPLVQLNAVALGEQGLQQALTELQSQFDPAQGQSLAWARLDDCPPGNRALFLAFHHLVIDAVSWRILAEDLARLAAGDPLPTKTSSYRQWGEGLEQYAEREAPQFDYWLEQSYGDEFGSLSDWRSVDGRAAEALLELDAEQTAELIGIANQAFGTEVPELLLTALSGALADLGLRDRHVIMLEGHGREDIDATLDVSRTVGWFTSVYPLALRPEADLAVQLCAVKERLRAVPHKGVGFNPLRVHHPRGSELRMAPVVFNYLGVSMAGDGDWTPLPIAPGRPLAADNQPAELISLHGGVFDGRLTLRQVGSLRQELSEQLMQAMAAQLRQLLALCREQYARGQRYTPSDFPLVKLTQSRLDQLLSSYRVEHLLPLSSLQESMLHQAALCPQDSAYHLQTPIRYRQLLDIDAYRRAWQQRLECLPALRAALIGGDGEPMQLISGELRLPLQFEDLSKEADPQRRIAEYCAADLANPFALDCPPLLRLACFKLAEDDHQVIFSCHHALLDGWSGPQLLGAVHRDYLAALQGQPLQQRIDDCYLAYGAYIASQRAKAAAYWRQQTEMLTHDNPLDSFFGCDLHAALSQQQPAVCAQALTAAEQTILSARATELGVTPGLLAQYAWHRLLASRCGFACTLVGNVSPGREYPLEGIEQSVGLYINSLPLALDWRQPLALQQHIQLLQTRLMELNQHATQSLIALHQGRKRLFQSLFVYENYPADEPPQHQDSRALKPEFGRATEKVELPLNLVVREHAGCLLLRFEFDAALIDPLRAEQVLALWRAELLAVVQAPLDQPIAVTPSTLVPADEPANTAETISPPTGLAAQLAHCWQQTLGLPHAVWQQDFTQLGIDSLQQLRLVAALQPLLHSQLSLAELKACGSPALLYQWLRAETQQPREAVQ